MQKSGIAAVVCITMLAAGLTAAVKENYRYLKLGTFVRVKVYALAPFEPSWSRSELAIDDNGNPMLAFFDGARKRPVFMQKRGDMFSSITMDESPSTGENLHVFRDTHGFIHTVYYDEPRNAVKYACNAGGPTFSAHTVDRVSGMRYASPQVAADKDGVHVYYLDGKGVLYHAVYTNNMFMSKPVYREKPLSAIRLFATAAGLRIITRSPQGKLFYMFRNDKKKYITITLASNATDTFAAHFDSRGRMHLLSTSDKRTLSYTTFDGSGTLRVTNIFSADTDISGAALMTERLDTPQAAVSTVSGKTSLLISEPGTTGFKPLDVSSIGRAAGDISLVISYYPYISMLFVDRDFAELRLASFNLESLRPFLQQR